KLIVSIRTGMFNPDEAKYANGALVHSNLPVAIAPIRGLSAA
ncbi:hypothetical protein PSYPI_47463, partial [Pseudomonas syringae pv. pisi str. 1704B]